MWYWAAVMCLAIYFMCAVWFLCGSAIQLHLLWQVSKKSPAVSRQVLTLQPLRTVTIQVPVYNERYVIARLLTALAQLNYPKNLYDIQVLDDSTDDTSEIIRNLSNLLSGQGITINILRRQNRTGYKAGALQAGLEHCKGELIAIFDADFIPKPDFLDRMSVYFSDKKVGGVQGRWTHQNLNENPLTVIQAYLLDSHFSLEQRGRGAAGYFLNFNGTAGVWRKQCILESGGWNGEVLTEDLELSYRAQLAGWKFLYDNQVTVPAELPADMNAFKTQQFRWAKGMAQTASKHLGTIARRNLPAAKKLHATFHLLSSISFLAIMGNILMTAPILAARHYFPAFHKLSNVLLYTGITLPVLLIYYYFGTVTTLSRKLFWKYLPLFLAVYSALSVQNSIAVIQGLTGHSSPFVRTPKLSGTINNTYVDRSWTFVNWLEVMTAAYILSAIIYSVYWADYFLILFLFMTFTGLLVLVVPSIHEKSGLKPRSHLPAIYPILPS
jgi:cellulose synthase/poly-beta-1,6-N-acetylglucosamine synthase-like glycosyltransferase